MYIIYIFLTTLAVFIYYFNRIKSNIFSEYVKSSVDNKYYFVRNNEKKQEAADTLAKIKQRLDLLINHLKGLSRQDCGDCYLNVKFLEKRYETFYIFENVTLEDTSYTIDKSSTALCLTTRDSNETFYDINELMFVSLHELAHVGCIGYGHGVEFIRFFTFLINKSKDLGIYNKIDYSKSPSEYCGIIINKNVN